MTTPEPRVAVLDDDAEVREKIGLVLADAGYRVLPLPVALAALARIRAARPTVVLLDVWDHCPGWGVTLLHRLRDDATTRAIPVIGMSVEGHQAAARARYLATGCVAVIGKPFDLEELLQAIRANCGDACLAAPPDEPPHGGRARWPRRRGQG